MMPSSNSNDNSSSASSSDKKYRGVRQRRWGRYVTEIRLPNSRERIWLGSYDSPEKAARAFDAAAVCLRGSRADVISRLNFPNSPPEISVSTIADGGGGYPLSAAQIQAEAARHANGAPSTTSTPPVLDHHPADYRDVPEPSNDGREVPTSDQSSNVDWSFMDEISSPVRAMQAGLDYGCDFMQLPESAHQVPDDSDDDDHPGGSGSTLWSF